jgi:hypothetical protein
LILLIAFRLFCIAFGAKILILFYKFMNIFLVKGMGKSKCSAFIWLCVLGSSSFDFAEALAFHFIFSVVLCRKLSVMSFFTLAPNIILYANSRILHFINTLFTS